LHICTSLPFHRPLPAYALPLLSFQNKHPSFSPWCLFLLIVLGSHSVSPKKKKPKSSLDRLFPRSLCMIPLGLRGHRGLVVMPRTCSLHSHEQPRFTPSDMFFALADLVNFIQVKMSRIFTNPYTGSLCVVGCMKIVTPTFLQVSIFCEQSLFTHSTNVVQVWWSFRYP